MTDARTGSILVPVIAVLLLIAGAATAMTLQARTSLREAATRRDRLALGFIADAAVRSAAGVLAQALADRKAPPFRLDGTPQICALPRGGRLVLAVQDEGGLVDLNKASQDLLMLVLGRAGLSSPDAKAATEAIVRPREHGGAPFDTVDELESMPGVTPDMLDRLLPLFTVTGGSTGIDPAVVGPELRELIPARELSGPTMKRLTAPSASGSFVVTGTAVSRTGMRMERRATLSITASAPTLVRLATWDAPVSFTPLDGIPGGAFCERVAESLGAG